MHRHRHRHRQIDRDREADRNTETDTVRGTQIKRHRYRQTDRQILDFNVPSTAQGHFEEIKLESDDRENK